MGILNLFKKKKKEEKTSIQVMAMFNNNETFDISKLVGHLESNWNLKVKDSFEKNSAVLKINNERIILMGINAQIPWNEIKETGKYSHNWESWETDLSRHNSHVVISILGSFGNQFERALLHTKIVSSLLSTSNSIGVYDGTRTMLIQKDNYIKIAEGIKNKTVPVQLWVYIGFSKNEEGNSLYTYGLKTFGKREMEIVESKLPMEELYMILHNLLFYVISSNVTFNDGHSFTLPTGSIATISELHGKFVDEEILKINI